MLAEVEVEPGPPVPGPTAVSADGRVLAVGAVDLRGSLGVRDCRITFWDLTTGKKLAESQAAHKGSVTAVAFSPDGKTLASAGADRTLRLWQSGTGKQARKAEGLPAGVERLAFSPDGRTLVAACQHFDAQGKNALRLLLWETLTLKERKSRDLPAGQVSLRAFSEDAKWLAYTDADGSIHVADVVGGQAVARFTGQQGEIFQAEFSRDRRLLATGSRDGTIMIWDLR
jgi:WD40 repeat protein